jgi:hypothetical protein
MRMTLPRSKYSEPAEWREFFRSLLDNVRALPGVQSAGATTGLPSKNFRMLDGSLGIEGREVIEQDVGIDFVTPDSFRSAGIPLIRGRGIEESDRDGGNGHRTGRSLGARAVSVELVVRGGPDRCGHFRRGRHSSDSCGIPGLLSPRPTGDKGGPARGSAVRVKSDPEVQVKTDPDIPFGWSGDRLN